MGCDENRCGGCRETILGQIRMIELAYGIRITNSDELAGWIVRETADPGVVLSLGLALGSWVSESGRSGDVTVPEPVFSKIMQEIR